MASNTDEYYIARSLNGHPDDFRHLVRRYQSVLMAHLVGQLGDKNRAEEAAQETLVRSYFNRVLSARVYDVIGCGWYHFRFQQQTC